MIVDYKYDAHCIIFVFTIELDKEDRQFYNKPVRIVIPDSMAPLNNIITIDYIHADLLALCAIIIVYPFIVKRLCVPFGVSKQFAQQMYVYDKQIYPINKHLTPRIVNNGVNCMLYKCDTMPLIQPINTIVMYIDSINNNNSNVDKVYSVLDTFIQRKIKTGLIKSDIYDLVNNNNYSYILYCIPAILWSDFLKIKSIQFTNTINKQCDKYIPDMCNVVGISCNLNY